MSPGIFPVASDSSMCPGVDSASKSEYQDNLGGKGGRCLRLTTYHLHVPIVKKSGGLNLLEPCGPVQACKGNKKNLHIMEPTAIITFCLSTVLVLRTYEKLKQEVSVWSCLILCSHAGHTNVFQ